MALTHTAHRIIRDHFTGHPTRQAVDATCGNGHDTLFLLSLGFTQVWSFDIQTAALRATRTRLQTANLDPQTLLRSKLIEDGHQNMEQHVKSPVDCIMFNLGYLPHADKAITTQGKTSLAALKAATRLLSDTGIISVLCYPGHDAGRLETNAIQQWLADLDADWQVRDYLSTSPQPCAPILYTLVRKC